MGDAVVRVESLGKQYRIGARRRYRTLRESLVETATAPALAAPAPQPRGRDGEPHLGAPGSVL